MDVMIFYMDAEGKRRGWAKGPEENVEEVRQQARGRLQKWIDLQNEALGEDQWSFEDFEEFLATVRETS